jgi:hypothetical protein
MTQLGLDGQKFMLALLSVIIASPIIIIALMYRRNESKAKIPLKFNHK